MPALASGAVYQLFQKKSAPPDRVVAHTGGRDVILAIEDRLAALERSLDNHPDSRRIWLTAFGAGFSAHAGELTLSPNPEE